MVGRHELDSGGLVVLFADLQPALIANSGTNPPGSVEAHAGALAEVAAILAIPMLFSVVPEDGKPASPLPCLERHVDAGNSFTRQCASPFGDVAFVAALQATGRRTLVIAGYSSEAVVLFAALDALEAGYDVVVALDAGGGSSERTEAATMRRIERAGATVTSVIDVAMSCAPDFTTFPGRDVFAIIHEMMKVSR